MEKIKINRSDALRYMGFRDTPDEQTNALIDKCEERLLNAAEPRYVWRAFDIENDIDDHSGGTEGTGGELRLSGCGFTLSGESVRGHLRGCEKAAVIASTLSAGTDRFLKRAALEDGLTGLVCDALASAYVEQVMEQARAEVLNSVKKSGGSLGGSFSGTWVFAAGYGDLPLETNRFLIECIDGGRKIGVSCTDSFMLIPQKTIVGIMGLSATPIDNARRSCENCNIKERCQFRKNGFHCN